MVKMVLMGGDYYLGFLVLLDAGMMMMVKVRVMKEAGADIQVHDVVTEANNVMEDVRDDGDVVALEEQCMVNVMAAAWVEMVSDMGVVVDEANGDGGGSWWKMTATGTTD